jgi:Sulfotransferase family
MSNPHPLNLLAIVGTMRSGSTLLDMLLGDNPAVFSGGEVRTIWSRGYLQRQPCSCGEPIERCELWSAVIAKAFGSVSQPDPAPHHVAEWRRTALRQRHTLGIARAVATDPDLGSHPVLRDYRQTLLQLYQAIAAVTGRPWVVDSSKLGADAVLVSRVAELHTRVLHLTRDPRGVVYSWSRGHPTSSAPWHVLPSRDPARSTLDWLRLNTSAEIALRSVGRDRLSRLRYEDFAADPFVELGRLSTELGVPVNENRVAGRSLTLAPNHLIGGNPARFRREVTIRLDDQWVSAMPRWRKLLIGAATSPLLLKYGYSLGGPPGEARR